MVDGQRWARKLSKCTVLCSERLIITGCRYYDHPPSTLEIERQLMNGGEHVDTGN